MNVFIFLFINVWPLWRKAFISSSIQHTFDLFFYKCVLDDEMKGIPVTKRKKREACGRSCLLLLARTSLPFLFWLTRNPLDRTSIHYFLSNKCSSNAFDKWALERKKRCLSILSNVWKRVSIQEERKVADT